MNIAKSFRDLKTYEKARAGAKEIYDISKRFPSEERYSLTSQIRRSSRATTALLAEAWARRRYKAAFVNKVDEALGEAMETQAWPDHALDLHYITLDEHARLDGLWQEVGAMLTAMINRADDFCKNAPDHQYLHEEPETYDL
jgi:four helix bundle protein